MAGLLAKVAAKKKDQRAESPTKKKETVWHAPSPEIAEAISELKEISAEEKALKARAEVHKTTVKQFAEGRFYEDYADLGVPPETPMKVQNDAGQQVTFVVQDRSAQYGCKDSQKEAMELLLGPEGVEEVVFEETRFGLSRDVLAREGALEIVDKALESATRALRKAGVLGDDEELIDADVVQAFKPGCLKRVAELCGRDTARMRQFVEAMGSSAVRYVKS